MTAGSARPNVILILTDDQGYGDLACTGNRWIRTPEIDRFHDDAVRLPDFHVAPLCAPTRGALMTGKRPVRNGVWGVCRGRSLLYTGQETIADRFAAAGYRTGMVGKWHLGDNYPYRPHDRGFEWALYHKGGGVGQTPDHWGNNYFDDTYFENGEPKHFDGYCTDIWFDQAMRFIEADGGAAGANDAAVHGGHARRPFFLYLATNAPHDPYLVPDRYTEPYAGNADIPFPAFYGMIGSIDENLARLRAFLRERDLEENTILIFMTDNGSSGGCRLDEAGFLTQGYNAGMRGKKGSLYEGGHRVPFFVRWPAGGWTGGRDVAEPGYDIDLLPTLAEACGVEVADGPNRADIDGRSLVPLLDGKRDRFDDDRAHFVQFDMSAIERLDKWHGAVLTRDWRFVHGTELYDAESDPGQTHDLAGEHPDVVRRLRDAYEQWWSATGDGSDPYARIVLGDDHENPTRLDAFDVRGDVADGVDLLERLVG
ncbi:MAG: arylsulfatase, partial [Spirochaetota bacterium]